MTVFAQAQRPPNWPSLAAAHQGGERSMTLMPVSKISVLGGQLGEGGGSR